MKSISRRGFIKLGMSAGALAALGGMGWPLGAWAQRPKAAGRVVIVGGGFGGTTCAKYLRLFSPDLEITLIEPRAEFITCPFSNTVIGGMHDMKRITHSYEGLRKKYAIDIVRGSVSAIDPAKRMVLVEGGGNIAYERLVVSPGISFRWNAIEGYDEAASKVMPHAWQPGEQTLALRKQLEEMRDGGLVVIAAPADPFRCPPGPYERASLIANYLKQNKPKSKILILDAKDKFSKQGLFQEAWNELYPGMIDWMPGSQGGVVERVDVKARELHSDFGRIKADVANIIAPHHAGQIAHQAGLTNESGWCPVDQGSFESTIHKGIHVIGDACIAGQMPKSAFSANNQAKVCAAAIVAGLKGAEMPEPSYANVCYSFVAPDYGISISAVYRLTDKGIEAIEGAGGVSPAEATTRFRRLEAAFASGWYDGIVADMLA